MVRMWGVARRGPKGKITNLVEKREQEKKKEKEEYLQEGKGKIMAGTRTWGIGRKLT